MPDDFVPACQPSCGGLQWQVSLKKAQTQGVEGHLAQNHLRTSRSSSCRNERWDVGQLAGHAHRLITRAPNPRTGQLHVSGQDTNLGAGGPTTELPWHQPKNWRAPTRELDFSRYLPSAATSFGTSCLCSFFPLQFAVGPNMFLAVGFPPATWRPQLWTDILLDRPTDRSREARRRTTSPTFERSNLIADL